MNGFYKECSLSRPEKIYLIDEWFEKFKGLNFKIHSLTLNQSATVYLQFVQIRLRNLLTKQQTCLTEKIS